MNVRIFQTPSQNFNQNPREVGCPPLKVGLISLARHRIYAICYSRKQQLHVLLYICKARKHWEHSTLGLRCSALQVPFQCKLTLPPQGPKEELVAAPVPVAVIRPLSTTTEQVISIQWRKKLRNKKQSEHFLKKQTMQVGYPTPVASWLSQRWQIIIL